MEVLFCRQRQYAGDDQRALNSKGLQFMAAMALRLFKKKEQFDLGVYHLEIALWVVLVQAVYL